MPAATAEASQLLWELTGGICAIDLEAFILARKLLA
jgi:hypothetical protein